MGTKKKSEIKCDNSIIQSWRAIDMGGGRWDALTNSRKEIIRFLSSNEKNRYKKCFDTKNKIYLDRKKDLKKHGFYKIFSYGLDKDLIPFDILEIAICFYNEKPIESREQFLWCLDLLERFCTYFFEYGKFKEGIGDV